MRWGTKSVDAGTGCRPLFLPRQRHLQPHSHTLHTFFAWNLLVPMSVYDFVHHVIYPHSWVHPVARCNWWQVTPCSDKSWNRVPVDVLPQSIIHNHHHLLN